MKMLFVNYISTKTPPILYREYLKQHRVFVTSTLAHERESIAALVRGKEDETKFIEGLTKLREIRQNYDCPILYLDNDCVMLNRVDDLFIKWDFDVAAVYRYDWEEHGGHQDCLGGFLFLSGRRRRMEDCFLEKLIDKTKKRYEWEYEQGKNPWYYDQLAINDLVGRPPKERQKLDYILAKPYKPCLKIVDGIRVLFLSANEWACPMTINLPKKVRIIHYNHAHWPVESKDSANGKSVFRSEVQPTSAVSNL